jgi:hypothetical protein
MNGMLLGPSDRSWFLAYYGLKEYDSAFEWWRRAIDDRNLNLLMTIRWFVLPGLSDRPDYAELIKYLDSLQRWP